MAEEIRAAAEEARRIADETRQAAEAARQEVMAVRAAYEQQLELMREMRAALQMMERRLGEAEAVNAPNRRDTTAAAG